MAIDGTDTRSWLLARLDEYGTAWPSESTTSELVAFIERQPRCFERDCFDDGHVTGSAWIVCPRRERTLLTHHRKLAKWLQLGGHSDGDPNALRVATREAVEESGLCVKVVGDAIFDIDIHRIPARGADPAHKHYDIRFLFEADDTANVTVSDESNALRWQTLTGLPNLTDEESMLRMARKTSR